MEQLTKEEAMLVQAILAAYIAKNALNDVNTINTPTGEASREASPATYTGGYSRRASCELACNVIRKLAKQHNITSADFVSNRQKAHRAGTAPKSRDH